jgi:hypothetical protein
MNKVVLQELNLDQLDNRPNSKNAEESCEPLSDWDSTFFDVCIKIGDCSRLNLDCHKLHPREKFCEVSLSLICLKSLKLNSLAQN